MARNKSRRSELKAFLTEEELALLSLGRAAEGFLYKHYAAQRVRAERDELWHVVAAGSHDEIWNEDDTEGVVQACFSRSSPFTTTGTVSHGQNTFRASNGVRTA